MSMGGGLQAIGSLALFILPSHLSKLMYFPIAPLIGLAGTSMLVTVIGMTCDHIGKRDCSAKVTHRSRSSLSSSHSLPFSILLATAHHSLTLPLSPQVFGLYSFSDKLCSGLAVYAIQSSLSCGDCCTHTRCCGTFYRRVLGLVPLGAAVISFAILLLALAGKEEPKKGIARDESRLLLDPTSSISDNKTYSYRSYGALDES